MNDNSNRILVLAIGNDLMGDNAVTLLSARELKKVFGNDVDIFEVSSAGFSLLDVIEGYSNVLIINTIPAFSLSECSIMELSKEDLSSQICLSPHYAGIPKLLHLTDKLNIKIPVDIRALVVSVHDFGIIREGLSSEISNILPLLVQKASGIIEEWFKKAIYI